jgi:hypothetical protein
MWARKSYLDGPTKIVNISELRRLLVVSLKGERGKGKERVKVYSPRDCFVGSVLSDVVFSSDSGV